MRARFVLRNACAGVWFAALAALCSAPAAQGDVIALSASDLAKAGAEGVRVSSGGEYVVHVWAPQRQSWSATFAGSAIALAMKPAGDNPRPAWSQAGKARIEPGSRVTIAIATDPRASSAHATEKPEAAPSAAAAVSPVPALVVLSSEPQADPAQWLALARGNIDSVAPAHDPRRRKVRTNQEGAGFRAPGSADVWRLEARELREHLLVTLGLLPMLPKTPLNPVVRDPIDRDGYVIEHVTLETMPDFYLSGNLYRPKGKTGKLPVMLCPHGHWNDGRMNPEVQARCAHWAKLGAIVFSYDMVGYNDSKAFGHAFASPRLTRYGMSLATLQTYNSIRAVDWLSTLPDADPGRIACTGESGGGTQTFLLAAIEPRIAMCAPVVMVSDSFQGGCVCENSAGLRIGTDNVAFAALAAPRPMKLVGASGDWTKLTMSNAYPAIRDVYRLLGADADLSADVFDFPHNYNETSRFSVYSFLAPRLLGSVDPALLKEKDFRAENPDDLACFNTAHQYPGSAKTPAQLEEALVLICRRQTEKLAPRGPSAAWEAARGLMGVGFRERLGFTVPSAREIESHFVRTTEYAGWSAAHAVAVRASSGEATPFVTLAPEKPSGKATIVMSGRGKLGLLGTDGRPLPVVQSLLELGQTVIGFDPLYAGEAYDPLDPKSHRPDTAHFDCYNRVLAGDRLEDLALVLGWALAQSRFREVNVLGIGGAGPLVLLAAAQLEGARRVAVDLEGFDDGDGSIDPPAEIDLPGILRYGGLAGASALRAPLPLWISAPGANFASSFPLKAYELADAASALAQTAGSFNPEAAAHWLNDGASPTGEPK